MISAQKLLSYLSAEDYLLLEERATTKHEYLDGVIYDWQGGVPKAMAGGTVDHAMVTLNVAIAFRSQLRGTPCTVVTSEVRLHASTRSAYFYPDVIVSCSASDRARNDGFPEPSVIVEVLSPSTELFDRGEKFNVYQSLESLQSYVLVSPERRTIEVFGRENESVARPNQDMERLPDAALIALGALGLELLAADIFEGL